MQVGLAHPAGERLAVVGRERVLVMQLRHVHDVGVVGREDREVRVVARGDPALAGETGELRRLLAHPGHHGLQGQAALARLGPDQRQPELQRRDAAPRHGEVAVLQVLEVERRGRVVRDDEVDRAVLQSLPEQLAVAGLADRRAALERGRAEGDLLRREREVVRAGLDREPDAVVLGGAQHRQRVRGGQVQDVGAGAGPPGAFDDLGDREVLGAAGARGEELGVVVAVGLGGAVDRTGVLGVHDHDRVERREFAHVGLELVGIQRRELVDPAVQQEALEPEGAGVVQPAQLVDVARNGAAPEAHVDVHLVAGDVALDVQGLDVDRRRDAVERHVQDRGHTSGGRGLGGGGEALPLGAARLVDVHVRVDEPRDQGLIVGEFDDLVRLEAVAERLHRDDDAVTHADLPGPDPRAGEDPLAADHQVVVRTCGVVLILRHVVRILSSGERRSCFVGFIVLRFRSGRSLRRGVSPAARARPPRRRCGGPPR